MGQKSFTYLFNFRSTLLVFTLAIAMPACLLGQQVIVTLTQTNVTCAGLNNGSATGNVSGGTAPYTYLWSNGATTQVIASLSPGDYCVTVTDANQLAGSGCVAITAPDALGVEVYCQSQICGNVPDGKASAVPSNGTPPYDYAWNNGAVSTGINGLVAGTYTVTITDANGCITSDSCAVGFWDEGIWLMDTIYHEISCFGAGDGWIHVSAMSGSGDFSYLWSNGGTTADITNLGPGTYTVTVTDLTTLCFNVASATLTQPDELICTPSAFPANCGLNGTGIITATGGTLPYTYLWNTGQTDPSIVAPAGTYTVTVTDANGCTCSNQVVIINNNDALTIAVTPTMFAGCNQGGSAIATISGGTGNYAYTWDNGNTTATATNLAAGVHQVTVVDILTGCQGVGQVTIEAAPPLVPEATPTSSATCLTGGTATASASGGIPPYLFLWDNNQMTANASNLLAGQHTVTITDATGCQAVTTVTIEQAQGPTVNITVVTHANCTTGGVATAIVIGGANPVTLLWSASAGNQTTPTAINLAPGAHSVTVTDAAGCQAVAITTILQPDAPTAVISNSTPATCNANSGSATVAASGGTPAYQYSWNDPASSTTATASNLAAGTYTVTITDAAGCTATASVTITASLPPNVVIVAVMNANCSTPGNASASTSGGIPPYQYLWSNGETTVTAVNLPAGTYTVTVTDATNCTGTASVTITNTGNGIKIGDWVWYDDDQNGFQHPTLETGVPNIAVRLIKPGPDGAFGTPDDIVVANDTTNNNGNYFFDCVTPGTYVLAFSSLPAGFEWTKKDWVNNDCKDSDVKTNGRTDPFTIVAGQPDDLCFDAGIHSVCVNVTNAGVICCNQTICEGEVPAPIEEALPPVGGSGALEFVWMQFIQIGQAAPQWVPIPGTNGASYQPGPLFETTKFMRCARRAECISYLESNIIEITVLPAGSPGCDGFSMDFSARQVGVTGVLVSWTTLPEATEYAYTVQHSSDMLVWNNISTLIGKQDASNPNNYSYLHGTPVIGKNFYRIRRFSSMGQQAISDIRSIELNFSPTNGVLIAPNPVVNTLRIMNAIQYDTDVQIDIMATNGDVLHRINIPAGTLYLEDLPVQDLPSGMYMARIRFGNGSVKTLKIAKI